MKNHLYLTAILLVGLSLNSQNGAILEYKINSNKGATGNVKVNCSDIGSLSEFNMQVPQMPGDGIRLKHLVQNDKPGIIYQIDDKNKTYSGIKTEDRAKEDNKIYTVKKIGEETVNGYKCAHALVTEGSETHEAWTTKDIPDYNKYSEALKSNKRMGSEKRQQILKQVGCDGLPVKTIHKGNEREGEMTMELVKLEKKNFNKSDFDIPVGYTKKEGHSPSAAPGMKSQQELMNMGPEERAKYIEEMKKQYGQ